MSGEEKRRGDRQQSQAIEGSDGEREGQDASKQAREARKRRYDGLDPTAFRLGVLEEPGARSQEPGWRSQEGARREPGARSQEVAQVRTM